MVSVIGTHGNAVNVQIKGISEAIEAIRAKGKDILDGKDAKIFQASNMLQGEIQESIVGNRFEPKSVDTGNFGNSITVEKIKDLVYSVETDVEYAIFLEYGTVYISPRMHFRNSLARNRQAIIDIIKSKFNKV